MTLAHIAPIIVNKLFNLFRSFRNPNKTKPQTVQSSTEAIKASVNVNLKKIQCVEDLLRTALKAENLPPSPSLPTTLWSVDLLSTSYSYSRHVLILNFLKGEKGDVEKTLNLILSHLKYRLDNDIPDVPMYDENTPPPPRDKLGRPVMLMAVADFKINAVFSTKQSFVEWRIRELEKTIALFDWATVNSCVFVQDFRGFKLFGGLPSKVKEGISAFSKVKKDSYPEITAQSLFVNVPRIVQMLFSGIRLVIPARTMKKITIVQSKKDTLLLLLSQIDPSQLDASFGGLFRCSTVACDYAHTPHPSSHPHPSLKTKTGEYTVLDTSNKLHKFTAAIGELPKNSKSTLAWEYRIIKLSDGADVTDAIADVSIRVVEPKLQEVEEIEFFHRENKGVVASRFGDLQIGRKKEGKIQISFIFDKNVHFGEVVLMYRSVLVP